jgi:hypothetical protein
MVSGMILDQLPMPSDLLVSSSLKPDYNHDAGSIAYAQPKESNTIQRLFFALR